MAKNLKTKEIPQFPSEQSASGSKEPHEINNYDPIGLRIIELRRYHTYLEEKLEEKEEKALILEKQLRTRRGKNKAKNKTLTINLPELTIFPPPAYPLNFPSMESFQNKSRKSGRRMVTYTGGAPKALIHEKQKICVRMLIEQAGYTEIENESAVLDLLSKVMGQYLQTFAMTLGIHKRSEPFAKDKDLWNALQTTLQNFRINGISGLHAYYYENVVKKHDVLQRECVKMYEEVMKP